MTRTRITTTITVALLSALTSIGTAAAQDTGPYYNNSSSTVNGTSWFAGMENVTVSSLGGMATRTLSFIIGPGTTVPGGGGLSGPIILGLLVAGTFVGAVTGTRIGAPGGAVVALVATFGLISVGLAPAWLKIVILMLLGLVAATAVLRSTR